MGSESGGNLSILRDAHEDEQQFLEVNECDKIKNEEFHREVCDMLSTAFPELCFVIQRLTLRFLHLCGLFPSSAVVFYTGRQRVFFSSRFLLGLCLSIFRTALHGWLL